MPQPVTRTLWRSIKNMSSSSSQILEGVLAIAKPPSMTSAQVIRDVQRQFDPSALFAPWLAREAAARERESSNQKTKRKWRGRRATSIKMGHGGTLDPMATGVLILGIGAGTKRLGHFTTGCTKSYETVLLFGAETDTYDVEGKVVARKPADHITRQRVEQELERFRGKIMQKPPIFSALKVNGKKMYEYAREGKELPVEIKERPTEVLDIEVTEWLEGGSHEYRWPEAEAVGEEKVVAEKLLGVGDKSDETGANGNAVVEETPAAGQKRALDQDAEAGPAPTSDEPPSKRRKSHYAAPAEPSTSSPRPRCPAPAARIRMKVTSGFYVRSLCHDLGAAVDSLGTMASLVRTQQGEFELGRNVLEFGDLEKGEEVWGPKVRELLTVNQEVKDEEVKGEPAVAEQASKSEAGTDVIEGGNGGEAEDKSALSGEQSSANATTDQADAVGGEDAVTAPAGAAAEEKAESKTSS